MKNEIPKVDVEGWIRWEGAAHSPVPPKAIVETVGLNGDYRGPAGGLVTWQKVKKYRVLSDVSVQPKANDVQEGGTHYKDMTIQVWDVIDTWPIEQQIGYHRGNVLKYLMRMGSKDERLKEAKKAAHYAQKLVEVLSK